ncbi:MAG: hypothetical protein J6Y77_05865, partial [Paludibacteraceae bacterium]|nr:hypothetical protein [Paludibacteraceae bacterium]
MKGRGCFFCQSKQEKYLLLFFLLLLGACAKSVDSTKDAHSDSIPVHAAERKDPSNADSNGELLKLPSAYAQESPSIDFPYAPLRDYTPRVGYTVDDPKMLFPEGYVLADEDWSDSVCYVDVNEDGLKDAFLYFMRNDSDFVEIGEYGYKYNHSRRGFILALATDSGYSVVLENREFLEGICDGRGTYFPPELSVVVSPGGMTLDFDQMAAGGWSYEFKFIGDGFYLIEYRCHWRSRGLPNAPIVEFGTVNFLEGVKVGNLCINREALREDTVDFSTEPVYEQTRTPLP